jgi:hypothetical protein
VATNSRSPSHDEEKFGVFSSQTNERTNFVQVIKSNQINWAQRHPNVAILNSQQNFRTTFFFGEDFLRHIFFTFAIFLEFFASMPKPTFSRTLLVVVLLQAQPFSDTN